jgi:hypothetical protein
MNATDTPKTTVIEINGVKLEVDLRSARRVENIKVGTRVKVLHKEYSAYKVAHGIVVGFEPFEKLPTIIVACVQITYNETKIEFIYYNAETKDVEIVVAIDDDKAAIDRDDVIAQMDKQISTKRNEIAEIENRKSYFLSKFATYWEPIAEPTQLVA